MSNEEGNKLIAEFMDNAGKTKVSGDKIVPYTPAYHLLWDLLMPVVEKIESIKNSDDYEVDIFGNCCDIGGRFEATGKTKIEATWKAVIEFIQWYNLQYKTKTS